MGIMLQTPRSLSKKTLDDRAFLAAGLLGYHHKYEMSPILIGLKVYLRPIFLDWFFIRSIVFY